MIPNKPKQTFWSDEQWLAIHATGKNILVNAGAGSGKTAVLTERIVQILKKGIGLDRLIVLTFTRAAASEMKERLRKRLDEEIALGDSALQAPLDYLDQANIQTFDAFALWLVRKYHYLLGVSRNIDIGDKVVFHTAKKAIIRQISEEKFEAEDRGFLDLVSLLCQKSDDNLQQYLSDIDEKMNLLPNKEEILNGYGQHFLTDALLDESIADYLDLIKQEASRISRRLQRLKSSITDETMRKHVLDVEEALSDLLASKSYEKYRENAEVSLPRLPSKCADPDQKELVRTEKEGIKKSLGSLRSLLTYNQTAEMKVEVIQTQKYAETLASLAKEIDSRFSAFKKANNLFGFMDIAKLAIRLVRDFFEVREAIRLNTYEILIDEYQDTSDVQDALISDLENRNLFLVGDVKQSIYRFRYANPDIFKAKYKLYEQGSDGMVIDLSKNFRSRREVLNAVNDIFARIMSGELGGVDYDDSQMLKYGNVHYSPIGDRQLQVLTYDSENYRLSNHEIEACILASDISKKIKEKYMVLDKETKTMRPVQYRDFAILTAEKSQFDLFKQVFESWNLPLDIAKDENILTSREIFAIGNLLKFIWSLTDEAYFSDFGRETLLGVLRSFVVEAKDRDIFEIFQNDLREGVKSRYPEFWEKCNYIAQNIRNSTTAQILGEIYKSFGIWEKILRLGNIEETENRLNFLLEKFQELDRAGYRFLDVINYLDAMLEAKLDFEIPKNTASDLNAVRMMSIHKSKGLEFPICYYPVLSGRFNLAEIREKVLFDRKYGIILPVFDEGLKDTFQKVLVANRYKTEEVSERLRLLYVAMTRAKEKIVVILPKNGNDHSFGDGPVPLEDRLNFRSLAAVFDSVRGILSPYSSEILNSEFTPERLKKAEVASPPERKLIAIKHHRVTLEKQAAVTRIASSKAMGLLEKEEEAKMELGTKIHECLEIIDFSKDIGLQIEKMGVEPLIKAKLLAFFGISLFSTKNIIKVYREHQFEFRQDATRRGIIDLLLETPEEMIIIDYKLGDLGKAGYAEQLINYREYVQSVTTKKISGYLYSIFQETLKKVF